MDAKEPVTSPAKAEDCSICFDTIIVQGRIDSCSHKFCFECISQWANVTNLCESEC